MRVADRPRARGTTKVNKGLTILDRVILVVILAVFAVVSVPLLSNSTGNVRGWLADEDVRRMQRVIDAYVLQHKGRGPHLDHRGEPDPGRCVLRLTGRTDLYGRITPDGTYGPYLDEWPTNPIVKSPWANKIIFGTGPPPLDGLSGWYYNTATCRILLNCPADG